STLAIDMASEMDTIKTHASAMNEHSGHTIKLCESGSNTVSILRRSADETEQILGRLGRSMERLVDQSSHIVSITRSITDFAHQTNILAINASIVASQAAGSEGKGFSVIASEIRELSDKSRTAASQIHQIISSL